MARTWAFLRVVFGRHEITPIERISMEDTRMAWWKDAAERLLWTFLQGALAIVTAVELGWIELTDGELWKAAAAGGLGASFSLLKSLVAAQASTGDTAQLGAHTYSYTATGPGAAGGDLDAEVTERTDAGDVSVQNVLIIVVLVLLIVFLAVRVL